MHYENKKAVKRQAYVDPLNTLDAILWTGRKAFKISHWQEEKKIGNLSSFFTLSFECLVTLVYFGFDSQMSFQKLPSCFFFYFIFMKYLIFPLKTGTITGT